jgi:hypothetical protein
MKKKYFGVNNLYNNVWAVVMVTRENTEIIKQGTKNQMVSEARRLNKEVEKMKQC